MRTSLFGGVLLMVMLPLPMSVCGCSLFRPRTDTSELVRRSPGAQPVAFTYSGKLYGKSTMYPGKKEDGTVHYAGRTASVSTCDGEPIAVFQRGEDYYVLEKNYDFGSFYWFKDDGRGRFRERDPRRMGEWFTEIEFSDPGLTLDYRFWVLYWSPWPEKTLARLNRYVEQDPRFAFDTQWQSSHVKTEFCRFLKKNVMKEPHEGFYAPLKKIIESSKPDDSPEEMYHACRALHVLKPDEALSFLREFCARVKGEHEERDHRLEALNVLKKHGQIDL